MASSVIIVLVALYFLVLPGRKAKNRAGNGKPNLEPTLDNIEPHIYPLVVALNATELCRTCASCDGHWVSAWYISEPYLAFSGDTQLAEKLDARLHADTVLPWFLTAGFGADRQLIFKLAINMDALWEYKVLLIWQRSWWWHRFQKHFDKDVYHLAEVVQEISNEIQSTTEANTRL